MSKRARVDEASGQRPIPAWLARAELGDEATRKLMHWMNEEGLSFVRDGELKSVIHADEHRFEHAVVPVPLVRLKDKVAIVVCETCCPTCDCCDKTVLETQLVEDFDNPHTNLCDACVATCKCGDDDSKWPDFCDGCRHGCRTSWTTMDGAGAEKIVCERCEGL